MMRILHVTSSMNPRAGGVSEAVRLLASGLNELNTTNAILSLDPQDADYIDNEKVYWLRIGSGQTTWRYNSCLTRWLKANVENYDVLVLHGIWLHLDYAVHNVLKYKRKRGAKVPRFYVMPHGMLDPYFQKAKGRKLKAIRNRFYWKLIESKLVNDAEGVLFTCEAEMTEARKAFKGYYPLNEIIVGYGVPEIATTNRNVTDFRKKLGLPKESKYLLFLGRIHEIKGIDMLLRAFESVYDNEINVPFLVIAGPGMNSSFGKSIQRIVETSNFLRRKVIFTGMLSGEGKLSAFLNCGAFILPSHHENFGISVVEAMACRKLVLISNKVKIFNDILIGSGGLVGEDSLDGVVSILKRFNCLSEKQLKEMSDNAYKVYVDNFKIETAAKRFLGALRSDSGNKLERTYVLSEP